MYFAQQVSVIWLTALMSVFVFALALLGSRS